MAMASDTLTVLPLPEVPDEVGAFAREKGVSTYLSGVVQMARRLFPHRKILIRVEGDPELSYNTQIVVNVDVEGLEADDIFDLHCRWSRELFAICPPTEALVFCLVQGL
jgi:hypothetical protein